MILLYLLIGIGWTVAQTVKVSGTVISDEDGQPIIGAAVTVRGAWGCDQKKFPSRIST